MNAETSRSYKKIAIAVLILLIVQLACTSGNVSPTDPRIQESLNFMTWNFFPWLQGLQFVPLSAGRPPVVTNITSDGVSGLGAIGVGDPASGQPPVRIRLYQMELNGCDAEPVRGRVLGETNVDFGGTWDIPQSLPRGIVVAATQVFEEHESGLSNLRINLPAEELLGINNEQEIQSTEHDTSARFFISGSSFPGACIVLLNQNMEIGRVGSVSVPASGEQQGRWSILAPLQAGETRYSVFIQGWDEVRRDLVFRGFFPRMHWPVGKKDGDNFIPDFNAQVNAFYGRNDYYVSRSVLNGFHDGIDIDGSIGTAILAVAEGDVFYIHVASGQSNVWDGGNIVFIDHGGWFSLYMHLSNITIAGLETPTESTFYDPSANRIHIEAGEKIGEMGNTGLWRCARNCDDADKTNDEFVSCCEHLHYSALTWKGGSRTAALGNVTPPPFSWSRFGAKININPTSDVVLSTQGTSRVSDRLKACASASEYWEIDWSVIPIWEPGFPSGTDFTLLERDQECAIP